MIDVSKSREEPNAGVPSAPREARARMPVRWGLVLGLAPVFLLLGPAGAVVIRVALLEAYEIDGPSFEPTLDNGDRVVVDKSAFGLWAPVTDRALVHWAAPEVGDVVIARMPDGLDVVKRVVGVGGDTIEIRQDVVVRNGVPFERRSLGPCAPDEVGESDCLLSEERSGDRAWTVSAAGYWPPESTDPMRVPAGHVYLLGDHRDRSNDSRNPRIGPVPYERVKGRVLFVYWSKDFRTGGVRWDRIGAVVR